MRSWIFCAILSLGLQFPALAQQEHVNRIDVFTAYSHLSTSNISLDQNGFNGSLGVNVTRWLALGTDFSVFKGTSNLSLAETTLGSAAGQIVAQFPPVEQPLVLAGLSALRVPFDASTFTWAAGPQLNLRHWDKFTLFARPGLGLIHESADLNLSALTALGISPSELPGVASHLTDTVVFYGGGGGFDVNASKHVGARFSVDYVHSHLFSDLLRPRNTLRISVGPTWRFGDISKK
jgi:hypothetical protein